MDSGSHARLSHDCTVGCLKNSFLKLGVYNQSQWLCISIFSTLEIDTITASVHLLHFNLKNNVEKLVQIRLGWPEWKPLIDQLLQLSVHSA